MANLVPLQLDKETGRIILSHHGVGNGGDPGSGGPPVPPGCLGVCGHVHHQSVASGIWMVEHNRNSLFFITQIFDDMNHQIQPDEVIAINPNQVEVRFNTNVTGRVHTLIFV